MIYLKKKQNKAAVAGDKPTARTKTFVPDARIPPTA